MPISVRPYYYMYSTAESFEWLMKMQTEFVNPHLKGTLAAPCKDMPLAWFLKVQLQDSLYLKKSERLVPTDHIPEYFFP